MKILLGTDGSPSSEAAAELICAAGEGSFHQVTVVAVSIPEYLLPAPWDRVLERDAEAQRSVEKARMTLSDGDFEVTTRVLHGLPGSEIVREAVEGKFDLVVVGWDGGSADIFGPLCFYILDHSPCPVLVVRDSPKRRPVRVLATSDGSAASEAAVSAAGRLFNADLVQIRVIAVAEAIDRVPVGAGVRHWAAETRSHSTDKNARQNCADAAHHFRLRGFSVEETVRFGESGDELAKELDEGFVDVAVVGARREQPGVYHMLGHVANAMALRAPATLIARDPLDRQ